MSSRYLIAKDRLMIDGIQLFLKYREAKIEFQFPPTIEGDSRRVNWKTDKLIGRDPLATYESNSAREMTLKFDYIVENPSTEILGDIWTIGRIKKQINTLRGYFTAAAGLEGGTSVGSLIAYFIHTRITGNSSWSVRIGNVNCTYSGPSIGDGGVNGFEQHPLKTTVTVDIATVSSGSGDNIKNWWDGIREFPAFEDLWY